MPIATTVNNGGQSGTKRLNLIMFMPDQLRYDSLGCTGNKVVQTPNIDKLAAKGAVFNNCFTQASVCTQSRCSMFTGQYLHTSGHRSLDYLLQEWEPNLFRTLKESGVHVAYLGPRGDTFAVGVTEMAVHEHGWIQPPSGFAKKFGSGSAEVKEDLDSRTFYKGKITSQEADDYDTAVVNAALDWLSCDPPEPFCLFLPLIYPHPPYKVEEPYYSMYKDFPDPFPSRVRLSDKTGYEPLHMAALRDAHGLERATEDDWDRIKGTYYGMITRLDKQFGEIVEAVGKLQGGELAERTYSMVFTDHGDWLGDYDLIEKFPNALSECLTRDPLIIAGPGINPVQVDGMTEMVDIVPTIYELLGIQEQYTHSGKSLVHLWNDPEAPHKQYAFSEGGFLLSEEPLLEHANFPYDRKAGLQHERPNIVGRVVAARTKEWTYMYSLYEPAQLYRRDVDPSLLEAHNLAEDPKYVKVVLEFERAILRWFMETSDYLPWKKDARFPEVNVKSTKEQLEDRRERLREMSTV